MFAIEPQFLSDPTRAGIALADSIAQLAQAQLDVTSSSQGNTVHFEGYFEVPSTGPYRFDAQASKAGAQARLVIAPFADPILQGTVSADGGEVDGVIELKAGTFYLLQFDCR